MPGGVRSRSRLVWQVQGTQGTGGFGQLWHQAGTLAAVAESWPGFGALGDGQESGLQRQQAHHD